MALNHILLTLAEHLPSNLQVFLMPITEAAVAEITMHICILPICSEVCSNWYFQSTIMYMYAFA